MQMIDNRFVVDQAKKLRRSLWHYRKDLTIENIDDHIQILNPIVAAEFLDLIYEKPEEIEYYDGQKEIAGMLIRPEKKIVIAQKFPPEFRIFTAAHEIGHWACHRDLISHRDISLDGSIISSNIQERQANLFAAELLMPSKLVETELKLRFPMFFGQFIFNDDTAFILGEDLRTLREMPTRYRSVKVASVAPYGGMYLNSMHQRFKVSKTAMAIRLETLGFVK
ncbi:MAG: ImmA/IrrE family metallo-endopeptidase [Gammaproteobacteria bacterium]|nr:ImmA/IrrE family metallo-endopeptidase [Gammaproteobacteria bacterium]